MERLHVVTIKYLPATTYKGARLRVKLGSYSIIIPYEYGLSGKDLLVYAARQLLIRRNISAYEIIGYAESSIIVKLL